MYLFIYVLCVYVCIMHYVLCVYVCMYYVCMYVCITYVCMYICMYVLCMYVLRMYEGKSISIRTSVIIFYGLAVLLSARAC